MDKLYMMIRIITLSSTAQHCGTEFFTPHYTYINFVSLQETYPKLPPKVQIWTAEAQGTTSWGIRRVRG